MSSESNDFSTTESTEVTHNAPNFTKEKHFYLNRNHEFVECELIKETTHRRLIKILEGEGSGAEKTIHPKGVAWGSMYPRLFKTPEKPTDFFIFRGRVLMKKKTSHDLVPTLDEHYRFQPFLSHIIDSINSHENTLLTGGAGVGKTTHVEQLAARTNQPLIRVNFNGETRLSDFLGKTHAINGSTKWIDGILPMAMREGYWLLLDEIDFADPSVLSLLHPVLEENPCLVLKENAGEVLRPHPNFRIFATANSIGAMQDRSSNFTGTNHMNEAFLDRWQILMIPALSQKEELKIVKNKVAGLKHQWAKKIVEFAHKVRSSSIEGASLSTDTFSTRRVLAWAKKTALLRSPIAGAKLAWLDKMPSGEHEPMLRYLELHFGSVSKRTRQAKDSIVLENSPYTQKKKRGRPSIHPK